MDLLLGKVVKGSTSTTVYCTLIGSRDFDCTRINSASLNGNCVIPSKRLPHVPTIVVELCGGSLDAEAVKVPEIPLVGRPIARLVLQVLGHLVDGQPVAVSRPVAEVLRAHLDLPPLPRLVRAVEDGRGEGVRVQARLPLTRVEQRQEHHCRDRD